MYYLDLNDSFGVFKFSLKHAVQFYQIVLLYGFIPTQGSLMLCLTLRNNVPPFSSFLQGAGTDDHTLIRVVVSRSEIDLYNIRKEFRKNFSTSLYSMIKVVEPFFKLCSEIQSTPDK